MRNRLAKKVEGGLDDEQDEQEDDGTIDPFDLTIGLPPVNPVGRSKR